MHIMWTFMKQSKLERTVIDFPGYRKKGFFDSGLFVSVWDKYVEEAPVCEYVRSTTWGKMTKNETCTF